MEIRLSLGVAALFLALGLVAGWRGARPPDPRRGPRMIPWRFIMVLSATGLILALAHAASLAGLGPPPR